MKLQVIHLFKSSSQGSLQILEIQRSTTYQVLQNCTYFIFTGKYITLDALKKKRERESQITLFNSKIKEAGRLQDKE